MGKWELGETLFNLLCTHQGPGIYHPGSRPCGRVGAGGGTEARGLAVKPPVVKSAVATLLSETEGPSSCLTQYGRRGAVEDHRRVERLSPRVECCCIYEQCAAPNSMPIPFVYVPADVRRYGALLDGISQVLVADVAVGWRNEVAASKRWPVSHQHVNSGGDRLPTRLGLGASRQIEGPVCFGFATTRLPRRPVDSVTLDLCDNAGK
eukprot:scaffold115263_cov69-Phaeocystis_antarctica.AAC.1